jgi:hypothetical protein
MLIQIVWTDFSIPSEPGVYEERITHIAAGLPDSLKRITPFTSGKPPAKGKNASRMLELA